MINVLIVDDSEIASKGIKVNIDSDDIMTTYVTSSKACIRHLKSNVIHVVVLDYKFHNDKNGFVQALLLRRLYPNLKILFLSSDDSPLVVDVLYNTGHGYMNKSSTFSYKEAIRVLNAGKYYMQADIPRQMHLTCNKAVYSCSLREKQICILATNGYSSEEIAELLNVSRSTVTRCRMRLRKNMGIIFDCKRQPNQQWYKQRC